MSKKNITAIVLAGGKSSRMGSDKALLLYKNKTFLEHVVCAIKPLVDEILIISDNKDHQVNDCTTIPDLILNSGPIAGIYTGLKNSKTENNLVLSCDIPLVQTSILEFIIKNRYISRPGCNKRRYFFPLSQSTHTIQYEPIANPYNYR